MSLRAVGNGKFWRVDGSLQSGELATLPSGLASAQGLAAFNAQIYTVDNSGDELWVNPDINGGNFTLVGSFPAGLDAPQAITSHNGSMYCADSGGDELWLINVSDPSLSTKVGDLPSDLTTPLGLTSLNGNLYCVDNTGDELWLINTTTPSSSTKIGDLPSEFSTPAGLCSIEGNLIGIDSSNGSVWIIDTTNPGSSYKIGDSPEGLSTPRGIQGYGSPSARYTVTTVTLDAWTQYTEIDTLIVPIVDEGFFPTYTVSNLPSGLSFDSTTREITGIPNTSGTGTFTVSVRNITEPIVIPNTRTYNYNITAVAATAPSWTDSGHGFAIRWTQYEAISTLTVPAVDSGHPAPTYSASGLPAGINFNPTTREITGTPTSTGTGTVRITATNDSGSDTYTYSYLIVAGTPSNSAPSFTTSTGTTITGNAGTAITNVTVPAASGFPTPTYAATGLPTGLTFNQTTRVISGTPTAVSNGTITVTATNSEGSADWTVDYNFAAALAAPSWAATGGADQSWPQNSQITTITVPAVDSANPAPTYSANGLPAGLSFNTSTRVISGTPTTQGTGTIIITASNASGSDTYTYDWEVTEPLAAPSFDTTSGGTIVGNVGTAITPVTAPAASGNPTPTYSATGLPFGFSFNQTTRVISGTAASTGTGTITVTASNSQGTATWTIDYDIDPQLSPPNWFTTSGANQSWFRGTAITTLTVPRVNSGNPPATYSIAGLPAGLSFDSDSTVREITGTPTTVGTGTITVTASNSQGSDTYTYAWEVAEPPARPKWNTNTSDLYEWTQSVAITPVIVPEPDSGHPPPTYTAANLPAGVSFNPTTRELSGTPTQLVSNVARIDITATNDSGSALYHVLYTVTVALVAPNWVATGGAAQSWVQNSAITDITVPAVNAANPAPTYSASGLPAGVTFDTNTRVLSGTPTTVGTGTLTITATNSQGSDTYTYEWTVSAPDLLELSDFNVPSGQTLVFAAVLTTNLAPANNGNVYNFASGLGSLEAGDLDVTDNFSFRVINLVTQNWVNMHCDRGNNPSSALASDLFESGGDFDDTVVWLQDEDGALSVNMTDIGASNIGGDGINIRNTVTGGTAFLTKLTSLEQNERFILALTQPGSAPSFATNTGTEITGTRGTAITTVTVPSAGGNPAPTYSAVGLPAGLSFNASTREITGTPTAVGTGTIVVTATNSAGSDTWTVTYNFSAPAASISFDSSSVSVNEGASQSVTITTANLDNQSVSWSLTGTNVFANHSGTVVPSGNSATITIQALDNAILDGSRTYTLTATAGTASDSVTVTVVDDETGSISISQSSITITEGNTGSITYTTNFSGNVSWSITGAGASSDFNTTSGTATASAGTNTLAISSVQNTQYRGNRNYTLTISGQSASDNVAIQITEDDTETITIVQNSLSVNEGTAGSITVNTNFYTSTATLNWALTGQNVGSVFTSTSGTISVTNNIGTLTILSRNDNVYTGNRNYLLTVSNANTSDSITVTVVDNESPPITIDIDEVSINVIEGNSFTVGITTTNLSSGTLNWAITGTNNASNFPLTSGTVAVTNNRATLTINTTENTTEERNRDFTLTVSSGTATDNIPITIEDDDAVLNRKTLIRVTQVFDAEDELIELYDLKFSNNTHYFQGTHFQNIQFRDSNGVLRDYLPLPMKITGIEHSSDGASNRPSLSVANSVFTTTSTQPEEFVGSRITRRQTLKKYLATNPPIEFPVQKYTIDRVASSSITITEFELAAPFDLAGLTLPKRKIVGHFCPWEYQGVSRFDRGGCSWPSNNTSPAGVQVFIDAEDNEITGFTMYDSTATYSIDDLVQYTVGSFTTIYKAVVNNPSEAPSANSTEWIRVETCGKRLASCKARFQRFASKTNMIANVPLPFGAFPGSRKFR